MRRIQDSEIHELVKQGTASGLVWASDWFNSLEKIGDRTRRIVYNLCHDRKVDGNWFFGYGTWNAYLTQHHGVSFSTKRKSRKGKEEALHAAINELIQETRLTSGKNWARSSGSGLSKKMHALYAQANKCKVDGKSFFGHGTWDAYLENVHGFVPLGQVHWSDERLHRTIAALTKKFPQKKVFWHKEEEKGIHGKSLKALYEKAWRSNQLREKKATPFFGHGGFKQYVAWAVKHFK